MALYACHAKSTEICRTKEQFVQWFRKNHRKLSLYDAVERRQFDERHDTFVDKFTDGASERVMENSLLDPTDDVIKAALKSENLKQPGDSFSNDDTVVEAIFEYEVADHDMSVGGLNLSVGSLIFAGEEGSADEWVYAIKKRKQMAIRGTISQFHMVAQESENGLSKGWLSAPSEDSEDFLKEELEYLGLTLIAYHGGMKKQKKPTKAAGSQSRKR